MVIPWVGFPLAAVIKRPSPPSRPSTSPSHAARSRRRCPGRSDGVLDWPYVEGLRIDEAMHPLALLAVGLYGEELPNQNGAPIRLVVPWKYGFKGIKSIVQITLHRDAAATTWNVAGAERVRLLRQREPRGRPPALEPGHRAPHRRALRGARRCLFNGYADQVASLYAGMDLRKFY